MKLATFDDGSRDGQLAVVSRDGVSAHFAAGIAGTLQQLLDDWNFVSPQLEDLYATLNSGRARHTFAFDPRQCRAPLPRAFGRAGGEPLQLLPSADLRGAHDAASALAGQPELAAVTGDIEAGSSAVDGIRLLLLSLAMPGGAAWFAPLAVTPDEAGAGWQHGRLSLAADHRCNGQPLADAASTAPAALAARVEALLQQHGRLCAGHIVGGGPWLAAPLALRPGDRIDIGALAGDGSSLFGAVQQPVTAAA